jgi:hypothetical protein
MYKPSSNLKAMFLIDNDLTYSCSILLSRCMVLLELFYGHNFVCLNDGRFIDSTHVSLTQRLRYLILLHIKFIII